MSVVIIGTGLAGYNLAKEFRKVDSETSLTMITSDDGANYSKPMLSTGFTKQKTAAELVIANVGTMADQLKCTIRTFTQVTAINTQAQTVHIGDEVIPYSKLILALGADVINVPVAGDTEGNVFSINDLIDYAKFREVLEGKKRVLIMGAGLIGCEFANDLSNGGYHVELVAPCEWVLPTMLPEKPARAVENGLRSLGVVFHFGPTLSNLKKVSDGLEATLSNGDVVKTDIVISAIGLRPRTALAKTAGLDVSRGIKVNRLLETSAKNVYALGDCAEVDGHVLLYVLPLMAAARALAQTLNNKPTPVAYPAMPVGVKTPITPLTFHPPIGGNEGQWEYEEEGNNVRAYFKNANGELRGFVLTGEATNDKAKLTKELPAILS
jgi:rubredoxin-NAD+ reductase